MDLTYSLSGSSPKSSKLKNKKPFFLADKQELLKAGFKKGKKIKLKFSGGIKMEGEFASSFKKEGKLLLMQFKNCLITDRQNQILYHPSWGLFDLAIGSKVVSVFSGPADRKTYPIEDDFKPSRVPLKKTNQRNKNRHQLYDKIERLKKLDSKVVLYLLKEIKKNKTTTGFYS